VFVLLAGEITHTLCVIFSFSALKRRRGKNVEESVEKERENNSLKRVNRWNIPRNICGENKALLKHTVRGESGRVGERESIFGWLQNAYRESNP